MSNALIKDLSRAERGRPGGALRPMASAATRAWSTSTWASARPTASPNPGISAPGVRRQGHPVRAGQPAAADQPLHRRQRRRGAAAQAGQRPVGKGQAQGRRAGRATSAAELLNIYARRAAREGHAFRYSPGDYEAFANDFGFEETADQKAAIHAVIQDMISPRPMDRLVCGDVRLRQDRGRLARRLRGRHWRQAGGLAGAHHAAGRAALPDAGATASANGRSRWPR